MRTLTLTPRSPREPVRGFCRETPAQNPRGGPHHAPHAGEQAARELWRKKSWRRLRKTADSPKPGEITAAAAAADDDDDDDDYDDDCPLVPVKRERSDDEDDAGPEIVAALDRILREVDLTRTTTNMVIRRLEDELPVRSTSATTSCSSRRRSRRGWMRTSTARFQMMSRKTCRAPSA